jgi:hypothetical protein
LDFSPRPVKPVLFGNKWQQRHLSGSLDRYGQLPLVTNAISRHPALQDLPTVRHEFPKSLVVLVINPRYLVNAESAYFAPRSPETSPGAAAPTTFLPVAPAAALTFSRAETAPAISTGPLPSLYPDLAERLPFPNTHTVYLVPVINPRHALFHLSLERIS